MTPLLAVLALLIACRTDPAPAALNESDCEQQPYPELQVTCRVQQAADAGRSGDSAAADAACARVPAGLWREECHFRAGESLAGRGALLPALSHCARAGHYGKNCLTHAAWGLPPDPAWRPDDPATAASIATLLDQAGDALGRDHPLWPAAEDELSARAWFLTYVGSGSADPAAARAAEGDQAAHARTAFAAERLRLADAASAYAAEPLPDATDPLEALAAAWEGAAPPLTGEGLPLERRVGRHAPAVIPPRTADLPRVSTFGGGRRLTSLDPEEDLLLAGLSALFFLGAPHGAFAPWTEDDRVVVRGQAIAYAVLTADVPDRYLDRGDPDDRAWAAESLKVRRALSRPGRPR